MIVVNLWGAPSGGKSTTMLGLGYLMKINKHRIEISSESVKDMIYENSSMVKDSIVVAGEQVRRQNRLSDVDYIITDCPIPLIGCYQPENYYKHFTPLLWEFFRHQQNVNFLMIRDGKFEVEGRIHNEKESNEKAHEIEKMLIENNVPFTPIVARPQAPIEIYGKLFPEKVDELMLGFV